jgi:hypothetical protein
MILGRRRMEIGVRLLAIPGMSMMISFPLMISTEKVISVS